MSKLSVARIVHYVPPGGHSGECMAAVVTFVGHEGNPALTVFWPPLVMPQPEHDLASVPQDEERANHLAGTWHWPERAEEAHVPGARPPRH
jgi:hypothetical protein